MPRRKSQKKKRKTVGIEAIVEQGVGAIYIRGRWMKKLDDLGKRKSKSIKEGKVKPK